MTAYPKSRPVRDKAWRRHIATMPCLSCGLEGSTQAAHRRGHGMGIKASDYECIPLCSARPGIEGCHAAYDRARAFPGLTKHATAQLIDGMLALLLSPEAF